MDARTKRASMTIWGLQIDREGDTMIVTLQTDLRELDYERIDAGAREVQRRLEDLSIKNVVLDFHKTDYFGSDALAFFVRVWKKVCDREGRMAFCNVSVHEAEILRVTKLDNLWPIYSCREVALLSMQEDKLNGSPSRSQRWDGIDVTET